jgi:hypothetical protein
MATVLETPRSRKPRPTPLYHAEVPGGPRGVSFLLGTVTVFAPVEGNSLYVVDPRALLRSGPVEAGMAAWVVMTTIEPRLARLGRREYAV